MREVRAVLEQTTDAAGRSLQLIDLPAPSQLTDDEGFVDWNYVNHLTVNGGVIACGYDDPVADARARDLLGAAYPRREVVTVDAREILARGGGIHCITQQQPARGAGSAA
jgi:agmatine deiminase